MELRELTAYAAEKYQILEQHKWADFPGFSVLCHPRTGQWVALLMRQWDTETGTEIERCDLKCGKQNLFELEKPYLSAPIQMRGAKWVGVAFDGETEPEVVYALFDRAIAAGEPGGFTIFLDSPHSFSETAYRDTVLPLPGSAYSPAKEVLPERLRQMRRMFSYGRESVEEKAKNFFRQAKFMEDYEDDAPWRGEFVCYFPTYRDMNTAQLRGYFSWRAKVRRGDLQPIPASAAYLYVYELLNGIGAASPEDTLQKLEAFEAGFLDSGAGDIQMRLNIRRWMLDFAVLHDLPQEAARRYAGPELLVRDDALTVLQRPEEHSDAAVFSALCLFDGKKLAESPVIGHDPDRGRHLFSEVWRCALSRYRWQEKDLFTLCFGERVMRRWYPLTNAVYYQPERPRDRDYVLDGCRIYRCRGGIWWVDACEKPGFDRARFQGFLHETDLRLRRYLKAGRRLRERPEDAWCAPYIDAVTEADRRAALAAARPRIDIDLSGLERIRRDALTTRDSLLSEEERTEEDKQPAPVPVPEAAPPDVPLNKLQLQILRALLRGEPADTLVRANHLMPSIVADEINEALFEKIGDVIILCEDDKLSVVEDYAGDISQMLGGA